MTDTVCIPVRFPDGTVVYTPAREYEINPPQGSFVLRERPRAPDPVVREYSTDEFYPQDRRDFYA